MPGASIKSDRSQTAKKVKVRTGCITCKIRKVKCDEIKPACKRCTDTGRRCDGYLNEDDIKKNKTRSLVAGRREKWSPPIPCIEINATCLLGMPTAEERIWLSHFSTRTGPMLSGLSDKDFWSRILPQLSSKEPAIRHALLAVSSSYARFEAEAATDRMMSMIGHDRPIPADASMERGLGAVSHGFTIKHYNLAIVSLQKNLTENPGKVELPLICCLLFICLECLYGNRLLMLNHLRNGLNILNSAQFWDERSGSGLIVKQKLQTILRRLDAQSTLYGNPVKPSVEELDSAPASTLPVAFADVFEVEQSLNTIISHCLNFIQTVHCGTYFSKEYSPRSPFPLQARLQEQLLVWRNKLDNFETASPPPDSASRDLARALRIQYIAIFIYLSNCLELSETSYDAFHANFATIISLARPLVLPETSTPPHPTPPPSPPSSPAPSLAIFTLDASLIPPLFLCAIKCRDSRIRRAAIDLMDANPCREGLWDARLHSLVARRVVEIEEGGGSGGPDGDGGEGGAMSLPETVRARIQPPLLPGEPLLVHRADIHAAAEQPEGAAARMTVYALRAGVLGEWVVWEEELGWARAPARKDSAEKWCRVGIVGESQLPDRRQLCRNV